MLEQVCEPGALAGFLPRADCVVDTRARGAVVSGESATRNALDSVWYSTGTTNGGGAGAGVS